MEQILNDAKFIEALSIISEQSGENLSSLMIEAEIYLKELYTVHHPLLETIANEASQYILSRGYDKTIDIDTGEIKKLAKVMRKHPVAFVMTHKTYIDMLVLRVVLARHGLPQPYIFGGLNMSFMGLGQLGRQAGVIFIRRSFKDNLVYKATLRHYISTLVSERSHFMWALEGTRSRTGKMVWPKMGILKYIMEAESDSKHEVKYIPVSIVYDLIPDVKEMTKEGMGKMKKPESLSWALDYVRKLGNSYGRISLRLGDPVDINDDEKTYHIAQEQLGISGDAEVSRFALDLVHQINDVTPVTTVSLICVALLSKYSLNKKEIESDVVDLMQLIENQKPDALVDRGKAIGESVQHALNLLLNAGIINQYGDSLHSKYVIDGESYLRATYYANMAVHHLYHRAFIEMALLRICKTAAPYRMVNFWKEIMALRDMFKFEFFYSDKPTFSDEIENDLSSFMPEWKKNFKHEKCGIMAHLKKQKILVAPVLLYNYLEAYKVTIRALKSISSGSTFDEESFMETCLLLGGELHWQGKIQHLEAVSKPFLKNGIRLLINKKLIPPQVDSKKEEIIAFEDQLDSAIYKINILRDITLHNSSRNLPYIPIERAIVPGSKTDDITHDILQGESGSHIGAFFDLDRTLIKGFSAVEFFQTRLLSGKMSAREIISQFGGVMVYAIGNKNFAGLAAVGAKGVKGIKEQVFIEVGEEVYFKHLAEAIYPESRALVAAHLAKGHTVAIVSAATPYQVNPVARDLGIDHVMCTRMEVENGKFTGNIVEPACWGDGKAIAAKLMAEEHQLDLAKSYFYTDSHEDMPLMDIVGHPRPLNPDSKLAEAAFIHDWPVYRFHEEDQNKIENIIRTGLTLGSLIPSALKGITTGALNMNFQEGINSMIASVGELGTKIAGITLAVKGKEYLWSHRPAVFLFNHQSSADLFIIAKLLKKDVKAVAKKELQTFPLLGQMMMAAGVIFIDRSNREKAIEAMAPAVNALREGTSIAIAPEGTRSKDYTLGKFKKGAFHLAYQAKVPIIPIVIKNAHDAMPKGTNVFRPTVVEVVVLPPVKPDKWKIENLDVHIDYVRQMYLKELGQRDLPALISNPN